MIIQPTMFFDFHTFTPESGLIPIEEYMYQVNIHIRYGQVEETPSVTKTTLMWFASSSKNLFI